MDGGRLRLHNSMGKRAEEFVPRDPRSVKVFSCGPSVYRPPHLGNHRTFLFEDLLVRYLKYKGHKVEWAMAVTDVEDKAIRESMEKEMDLKELTRRNESALMQDFATLGMTGPDMMVRASLTVDRSVELIKDLLENGFAYRHGHDVYFDPLRFPRFGRLFGIDMEKWPTDHRRFSKDTYPGNRWNRGDFILWHGCSEDDLVCWDDVLGSGRPSWNVQDGAMVIDSLGPNIDIWTGGEDNIVRHHDYNISVVEGAKGGVLANYWLHGGHLLVNGKKMSKSLGNILGPGDLLSKGYAPHHIRFFLLDRHYRRRLNLTFEALDREACRIDRIREMASFPGPEGEWTESVYDLIEGLVPGFEVHMDDDLDFRGAVATVERTLERIVDRGRRHGIDPSQASDLRSALERIDSVLGVIF